MTKGVPKKRQPDEQLRKKRLQAPPARAASAKTPPKAILPDSATALAAVWRR